MKDITRVEPKVLTRLESSLQVKAEQLAQLYEKDPQARVYRNITYRIGYSHSQEAEDEGFTVTYLTTEHISSDISTSPISTESKLDEIKWLSPGESIHWYSMPMSEPVPLSDLYTEK